MPKSSKNLNNTTNKKSKNKPVSTPLESESGTSSDYDESDSSTSKVALTLDTVTEVTVLNGSEQNEQDFLLTENLNRDSEGREGRHRQYNDGSQPG